LSTFDKEYWGEYQRLQQGQLQFPVLTISKFKILIALLKFLYLKTKGF